MNQIFFGIDLSGPVNIIDTVISWFKYDHSKEKLNLIDYKIGADDNFIFNIVKDLSINNDLFLAIDAPLSYNMNGGDRESDKSLREFLKKKKLKTSSVMTPTMTRMSYLTLRGISITRILETLKKKPNVIEVHPFVSLLINGANKEDIKNVKKNEKAKQNILNFLKKRQISKLPVIVSKNDHFISSVIAAQIAFFYSRNQYQWRSKRKFPFHPYDFVC